MDSPNAPFIASSVHHWVRLIQAASVAAPAGPGTRSRPPARSDADWTSALHWAAPGASDLKGRGCWSNGWIVKNQQKPASCYRTQRSIYIYIYIYSNMWLFFWDGHLACRFQWWTLQTRSRHTKVMLKDCQAVPSANSPTHKDLVAFTWTWLSQMHLSVETQLALHQPKGRPGVQLWIKVTYRNQTR